MLTPNVNPGEQHKSNRVDKIYIYRTTKNIQHHKIYTEPQNIYRIAKYIQNQKPNKVLLITSTNTLQHFIQGHFLSLPIQTQYRVCVCVCVYLCVHT